MVHIFNPRTQGGKRQVDLCDFKTRLVYIEFQDSQSLYSEALSQNKDRQTERGIKMKNGKAVGISCKKILTGPGDKQNRLKSGRPGKNKDRD